MQRLRHGFARSKIYRIWCTMRRRCFDPNNWAYKYYGGRGIKVCNEWLDPTTFIFWSFCNGYKEGLHLDRINTNGNYEPSNCRWVTPLENMNNKRCNILINIHGESKSLQYWCRFFDINYTTVIGRLKRNWNIERALFTPAMKYEYKEQKEKE